MTRWRLLFAGREYDGRAVWARVSPRDVTRTVIAVGGLDRAGRREARDAARSKAGR